PRGLRGCPFPAAAKAASGAVSRFAADLGVAYLVNTAGTTAGALAASFVLIPGLGVRRSLGLLAALTVVALALALGGRLRTRAVGAVVGAALLALVLLMLSAWDARRMHTRLSSDPRLMVASLREGTPAPAIAPLP